MVSIVKDGIKISIGFPYLNTAIDRMLITTIFSILSTGGIWNLVGLYKVDMPEHLKEKQLQKAINQTKT